MALQQWELQQQLATILPIDGEELKQIISYADSLPSDQASEHFSELLGDSPEALRFITTYRESRSGRNGATSNQDMKGLQSQPSHPRPDNNYDEDVKTPFSSDTKGAHQTTVMPADLLPARSTGSYAPPPGAPPTSMSSRLTARVHTNPVIEAATVRARDEVSL